MIKLSNNVYHWLHNLSLITSNNKNNQKNKIKKLNIEESKKLKNGEMILSLTKIILKKEGKKNIEKNFEKKKNLKSNWKNVELAIKNLGVFINPKKKEAILNGNIVPIKEILFKLNKKFGENLKIEEKENKKRIYYNKKNYETQMYTDRKENDKKVNFQDPLIHPSQNSSNTLKNCKTENPKSLKNTNFSTDSIISNSSKSIKKSKIRLNPINSTKFAIFPNASKNFKIYTSSYLKNGQKLDKINKKFINKEYIIQNEVKNSLSLIHKNKKIENSKNIFEILIIIISKSFDMEPVHCISLFLNDNEIFKELIRNGEKNFEFQRIWIFAKNLFLYKMEIFGMIDFRDKSVKDVFLFFDFLYCFFSCPDKNVCLSVSGFFGEMIDFLVDKNMANIFRKYIRNNFSFVKRIISICEKYTFFYKTFFEILIKLGKKNSFLFEVLEILTKQEKRKEFFFFINNIFGSNYKIINFCENNKEFYNFLLVKTTQSFFSYKISIDFGFETKNNFIDKINFQEFFQSVKLLINLLQINRYKIQNNMINSFVNKLIFVYKDEKNDNKWNSSKNSKVSTIEKIQLFSFIVFLYQKFREENFEIKINFEKLFFEIIMNFEEKNLSFKKMIFELFFFGEDKNNQFIDFKEKFFYTYFFDFLKIIINCDNSRIHFCRFNVGKLITYYLKKKNIKKKYIKNFFQITSDFLYKFPEGRNYIINDFLIFFKFYFKENELNINLYKFSKNIIDFIYKFEIDRNSDNDEYIILLESFLSQIKNETIFRIQSKEDFLSKLKFAREYSILQFNEENEEEFLERIIDDNFNKIIEDNFKNEEISKKNGSIEIDDSLEKNQNENEKNIDLKNGSYNFANENETDDFEIKKTDVKKIIETKKKKTK